MPKKPAVIALLSALCLTPSFAGAGVRSTFGLYISPSNGYSRYANGSFADARSSSDPNMYAECGTNSGTGFCTFNTSTEYLSCWTSDPAKLAVIRGMKDGGFFSVQWNEQTAECTYILQYTSSRSAPKGA